MRLKFKKKNMIKFLRKVGSKPDFWPILFVVLFGVFAGRILLTPGYFNMHDDLQMMRQLEMEKCFRDFQIPCRWVPDMGYGYGFPLFNYYPPLPYLIGQGIRLIGFSFVDTAKLTFFLSFVLSGVTMYLLAKTFWGRLGGVLSAVFYIWAPYHSVDVFVRGAMNEAWALVWFPLILWASYKLIFSDKRTRARWIIGLALSWFALLTSHNLMVVIFAPIFALWCVFWLIRKKSFGKIPQLIISGIWAFGLAAFFSIPVFAEQKLVHIDSLTVGYYEYIAHFANINQLFTSTFWGYGASVWENEDGMPFPVGHVHWVLVIIIGLLAIINLVRNKKDFRQSAFVILSFIAIGFFAAFMAHSRSTLIWKALPFFSIVQFPWRFLTLVIFSFSLVAGSLAALLDVKKLWVKGVVVGLMVGVVVFNFNFFKPEKMGPLTDEEKFSAAAWELQQTAGIYDYLPKSAKMAPQGPREKAVDIVKGYGKVENVKEGTNWMTFKLVDPSEDTLVRVNTFMFPNWKITVDGRKVDAFVWKENDDLGRIHFSPSVAGGEHTVNIKLQDTPPRTLGNTISAVSWALLLTLPKWKKRVKIFSN